MYVLYDKISDWEIDYIQKDILRIEDISFEFLYLSREQFQTVEVDFPHVVHNNIFVFSSNKYLYKDVLRIVKALRPLVIVQLSDEQGRKEMFMNLAKHTRLYLRNYNYNHYNLATYTNVLQFPLGYTSGYLQGNSSCEILQTWKPLHAREQVWSFVGRLKQDRQKMLRVFQRHMKPYTMRTDGNVKPAEMFDIYNNSIFVPCGRGNMRLECFRLYEVALAGAIPVVVGGEEEIQETFLFRPPFVFAKSWEEAEARCRGLLGSEELRTIQENIQTWWSSCLQDIHQRVHASIAFANLGNRVGEHTLCLHTQ